MTTPQRIPKIIPGRLRIKLPKPYPCPSCEDENVDINMDINVDSTESSGSFYVQCLHCAMQGPHIGDCYGAIVAWNDIKR